MATQQPRTKAASDWITTDEGDQKDALADGWRSWHDGSGER